VQRLVFLHGFTQTHHHWHRCADGIARRLAGGATLAFVDLPGHGLAGDDRIGGISECGPGLVELAGTGTYVGYSMGGRTALVAATSSAAGGVERLVLIGATPGLEDPDQRFERRAADHRLAARIEEIGIDRFLDEWLANPLFATLPPDPDGLAHRRRNTVAGLAHSLRGFGTGSMEPLWSRLPEIEVPTLILAGELDTKFSDIGRRMSDRIPHATFETVPGVGHAAHVEAPDPVAEIVAAWLDVTA
jgi:2-succinyl-6-hydroxy-2,4-cyclohexadiene-1-carboxylate synthase